MKDISVAGRVLAGFPERLSEDQRVPDELNMLGVLAKTPRCQHHQVAQHQRPHSAVEGLHHRVAEAGLQRAQLPRVPLDR